MSHARTAAAYAQAAARDLSGAERHKSLLPGRTAEVILNHVLDNQRLRNNINWSVFDW